MADILNIKRKPKIKFSKLSLQIYDKDLEKHKNVFTGWLEDDFSDIEEDLKFLHLLRNLTK